MTFTPMNAKYGGMKYQGIHLKQLPELKRPVLIAGFDGWGNALDVSRATIAYLIRKLEAECFAEIDPDQFYRYDETRPSVNIKEGILKDISLPQGSFYAARTGSGQRDLVILKADEPNLCWVNFADEMFSLCSTLGVKAIITLGAMYDNVLHSDRIVSGAASDQALLEDLKQKGVIPVNYQGPSSIHSIISSEGRKRGFQCMSLWCHCPYYLQGTTHFGILTHMASLLSSIGGFELDVQELESSWRDLNRQIQKLIDNSLELQDMINELRKAKVKGSWESMKETSKMDEKVIYPERLSKAWVIAQRLDLDPPFSLTVSTRSDTISAALPCKNISVRVSVKWVRSLLISMIFAPF